jgi:hypothetical protein
VSPPEVITATAQKLQQIGPSGRQKLLLYQLAALPVWLGTAVQLAGKYATRWDSSWLLLLLLLTAMTTALSYMSHYIISC